MQGCKTTLEESRQLGVERGHESSNRSEHRGRSESRPSTVKSENAGKRLEWREERESRGGERRSRSPSRGKGEGREGREWRQNLESEDGFGANTNGVGGRVRGPFRGEKEEQEGRWERRRAVDADWQQDRREKREMQKLRGVLCRYFTRPGGCMNGARCAYRHVLSGEGTGNGVDSDRWRDGSGRKGTRNRVDIDRDIDRWGMAGRVKDEPPSDVEEREGRRGGGRAGEVEGGGRWRGRSTMR